MSVIIKALKYNHQLARSWKAELIEENKDYWLFYGEFEKEIEHPQLGLIRPQSGSFEYYFKDFWFNIFRFHEPEGELKYYYCNLSLPPKFESQTLSYIDLDIDVLVRKDFSYQILDLDEFAENSLKYNYSKSLQKEIKHSLEILLESIKLQKFPFSKVLQPT